MNKLSIGFMLILLTGLASPVLAGEADRRAAIERVMAERIEAMADPRPDRSRAGEVRRLGFDFDLDPDEDEFVFEWRVAF